ncbi:mitochondrial proton/calcium exchanger protein-like isoform X2 [Homarus americanus]|uniref:mitochondrial proton/calcium exchanger protein-like isoform X2 n=1 Tax=Homarus americanus TaxID=6706 RepID=UPI001C441910|nr:mitochondrial proton/calcium exchanger protein-like isoform X2 [Homarus americanus]
MSAVSSLSIAVLSATSNTRNGFGRVSQTGGLVLRRPWHSSVVSARAIPEVTAACSIAHGNLASGWVTRGPGQHHGHSQAATPAVFISPALHVSYTTVHVPYYRAFHTSPRAWEKESSKPSSQVEVTVKDLKEKAKAAGSPMATDKKLEVVERKSLGVRIKEEILHYYHGFRLLFIDTKICIRYVWRLVNGETLSRREHRQLVRTTSDLFRLLPFSVFIIIPFMEILLPVALKLFPGMLPSTFETANEKEAKMKKRLKVKLEMAKFLQQTLDTMAVQAKGRRSESAKEFVQFFEKVTKTGGFVSNEEILKFSKLFEDEITLDSLSRPQLVALCRLLEMQPFGTNNFLRFQLRMKLRTLVADDKIIQHEGVESLAVWELQQACRTRGMRAYGLSEERLRMQLSQWLELSLTEKVPPSLLLLSRTLFLPESVQTPNTLAATISTLPDEVATRTKAAIGKREGKIDNLTRLEVIQVEERKIAEDKKELERVEEEKKIKEEIARKKVQEEAQRQEQAVQQAVEETRAEVLQAGAEVAQLPPSANKILSEGVEVTKATVSVLGEIQKADPEELIDRAPVLKDKAEVLSEELPKSTQEAAAAVTEPTMLTSKDLRDVEEAIETLGVEKRKLIIEEQELSELKSELADYKEDIEDFQKALIEADMNKKELRESKAAKRLFIRVNKMINRLEPVLDSLGKEKEYRQKIVDAGEAKAQDKADLVNLEELTRHLSYIYHAPDTSKVSMISDVLTKMDFDKDGAVEVDHVLHVLHLMLDEGMGVSPKLFEDVTEMMAKEEQLESAKLIQHALKTTIVESKLTGSSTSASPSSTYKDSTVGNTHSEESKRTNEKQEHCDNKDSSLESSEISDTEQQAKHSQ